MWKTAYGRLLSHHTRKIKSASTTPTVIVSESPDTTKAAMTTAAPLRGAHATPHELGLRLRNGRLDIVAVIPFRRPNAERIVVRNAVVRYVQAAAEQRAERVQRGPERGARRPGAAARQVRAVHRPGRVEAAASAASRQVGLARDPRARAGRQRAGAGDERAVRQDGYLRARRLSGAQL